MRSVAAFSRRIAFSLLLVAAGCSSKESNDGHDAAAGASGNNDATATSRDQAASGGSGGSTATGGSGGTGGATASGGSGGSTATGGSGGGAGATGTGGSAGASGTGGTGGGAGQSGNTDARVADGPSGNAGAGGGSDAGSGGSGGSASGNVYVYTTGTSSPITMFQLNLSTGALTNKGTLMSPAGSIYYLAWGNDRKFVYGSQQSGTLAVAFSLNPATGALTYINQVATGGMSAAYLWAHPSGKWIFVTHGVSGHVSVIPVQNNGGVGMPTQVLKVAENTVYTAAPDPAGKYLFSATLHMDRTFQYIFDETAGMLTPNTPPTADLGLGVVVGGAEPKHMAFHPSAKFAYVVTEKADKVVSFNYDAATGLLSAPEAVSTIPNDPDDTNAPSHVVVHPSGKFVYASNRGVGGNGGCNCVAMYSVNATTGRLTSLGFESAGGMIMGPRDFTVDPTGTFLLVANQTGNSVMVFRIGADGKLTMAGAPVAVPGPNFVGALLAP